MARKKGKGKKGKKGKKKEKKVKDMTEVTKVMFEIQVKDLTEKLDRCRKKCSSLTESNTDLSNRFDQLTADLGDVISFLKLQLENKREELAELTERLEGLDAQRTKEAEECTETRVKLQNDMKKMQAELSSEVQMLSSKLSSLEEFRRMREKLFAEKDGLEQQLVVEREEAEERVYQADKQRIIDSDQLKRDATRNIAAVAQAFQDATRRRVNQTTHRTIRENICLTSQMALVAERARDLEARNATLLQSKVENDLVLSALEWTERSLVSATQKHEVELAQLQDGNQALQAALKEKEHKQRRRGAEECRLQQLEERLSEQQALLQETGAEQRQQALLVARLTEELNTTTEQRDTLQTVVTHAGSVVRQALALPADNQAEPTGPRCGLLESLLAVLTVASLTDQPQRLQMLAPKPLTPLQGKLRTGALGILPGGDGALRLRRADSLLQELEDAAGVHAKLK